MTKEKNKQLVKQSSIKNPIQDKAYLEAIEEYIKEMKNEHYQRESNFISLENRIIKSELRNLISGTTTQKYLLEQNLEGMKERIKRSNFSDQQKKEPIYSSHKIDDRIEKLENAIKVLCDLSENQQYILESIYNNISKLLNATSNLTAEIHERFIPESLGIEDSEFPMHRFVPVKIFISNYEDDDDIESIILAIRNFIESLGYVFSDDFPSIKGSWWKTWYAKSKKVLTSDQVQEGLEKGKRALELAAIEKVQSEVNKNNAEAASKLIDSLSTVNNAAMQIGSLLLVKITNNGTTSISTRQLNQREMIALEKYPTLLRQPDKIIKELEKLSCSDAA